MSDLTNEDETNDAMKNMDDTSKNPFEISEDDSDKFLDEFDRVVSLPINYARHAFVNLKFLVDNYERDNREDDKIHRPSFKQRLKSPAQWSTLDSWYEKYGQNSVGTNLHLNAIEGFVFTLLADLTAEFIVVETCLVKNEVGKNEFMTNEDGQNRLNIYGELIGAEGHGVPFIKVSQKGEVSSLFSDEVKTVFKIAYQNNPMKVPNMERLEDRYKKKALNAKTPEDRKFWSNLGIDTMKILDKGGCKEAKKAYKIMEETLCQLKHGQSNEQIQRYLYRARSKHNAQFTHAQEAIEGMQDLYRENFHRTWTPLMEASLIMAMQEIKHSPDRVDKYYGPKFRKQLAGSNYDTKELNHVFAIAYGSMNFEGTSEGTNEHDLNTTGTFASSNATKEQTFDLFNKSINGQSLCNAQKQLEAQVSLHPEKSLRRLKELGTRGNNLALILRNLYEDDDSDSVLEKVDAVMESIEEHGKSEHPIKIRDLNSQNWFITMIFGILNIAHSQGVLELSSAVSTKKALDSLLDKIKDTANKGTGIVSRFEDLTNQELTDFIRSGSPQGKREELASSPKRFKKIREDGDSAYGFGTVTWEKLLWYVVWKFYIPEIKKELNADSKNQAHAQKICDKIRNDPRLRVDTYGNAPFPFLTDKNDIRIVKFNKDGMKNISLSSLNLNVEHNVAKKYLDFDEHKNPPRLGDAKANNTDNEALRDAYANVYLRNQAIMAKKMDEYLQQELLMNDKIRFDAELGHLGIDYDAVIERGRDIKPKCERTDDVINANNAETAFDKLILSKWKL